MKTVSGCKVIVGSSPTASAFEMKYTEIKHLAVDPYNYTQDFILKGGRYHYHGETDPHVHDPSDHGGKCNEWKVKFYYFSRIYRFFYEDTERKIVLPKIGVDYSFDPTKLHGVIRKEHIDKIDSPDFWQDRFRGVRKSKLACVFQFTDYR